MGNFALANLSRNYYCWFVLMPLQDALISIQKENLSQFDTHLNGIFDAHFEA